MTKMEMMTIAMILIINQLIIQANGLGGQMLKSNLINGLESMLILNS
jgi:hypothetical protein